MAIFVVSLEDQVTRRLAMAALFASRPVALKRSVSRTWENVGRVA